MRLLVLFVAGPIGFRRGARDHMADDADIRIPATAPPCSAAVGTLPAIGLKYDAIGETRLVSHLVLLDPACSIRGPTESKISSTVTDI
jgi:hypothetical protein